jgi:hypothetical protein
LNKIFAKILKISLRIFIGIIVFFILLYIGLWLYTINYVSDDFKKYYKNYEIMDLSDTQYKIIWYSISNKNDYKFKWRPFLFDIIEILIESEPYDYNYISMLTSEEIIIYGFGYRDLNNAHPRYYALERYIIFDNNWKKCISILVNNWLYGFIDTVIFEDTEEYYNNARIRTLEKAVKYYYNKEIKDITDRELAALFLRRFTELDITEEMLLNEKIDKILNVVYQ